MTGYPNTGPTHPPKEKVTSRFWTRNNLETVFVYFLKIVICTLSITVPEATNNLGLEGGGSARND